MAKKSFRHSGREQVREYIRRRRITQKSLAVELGIHEATLSAILQGHDRPSLSLAARLEDITGVPARAFAEGA